MEAVDQEAVQQKNRAKTLGTWIMVSSGVVAILIACYFVLRGGKFPLPVLAVPAIILLIGFLVQTRGLLEAMALSDELERSSELLEDDLQDLKHGRITRTWAYVGMSTIAMATELWLLDYFHKWYAAWGIFNVFLLGLGIALIAIFLMVQSSWFQQRTYRAGDRIYWLLLGGFILCLVLGVFFTEPVGYSSLPNAERISYIQSDAYWISTRAYDSGLYNLNIGSDFSADVECDDDLCMFFTLLTVVIVCAAASALIPHFWVIATMLMVTLMIVMTIRELLYRETAVPLEQSGESRRYGDNV